MGFADIFKGTETTIAALHVERMGALAAMREKSQERRQELAWKHQREQEAFDASEGKKIAEQEAKVRAYEAKLEAEIASEALAAMRSAAATFGDAPRTATTAIRDALRTFIERTTRELGATEPNVVLLAAAFVAPEHTGVCATEHIISSRVVAADLSRALVALAGDSLPAATYALQMLEISVDKAVHEATREGTAMRGAAAEVLSCASMRTLHTRVAIGDRFLSNLAGAIDQVSGAAERRRIEQERDAEEERAARAAALGPGTGWPASETVRRPAAETPSEEPDAVIGAMVATADEDAEALASGDDE